MLKARAGEAPGALLSTVVITAVFTASVPSEFNRSAATRERSIYSSFATARLNPPIVCGLRILLDATRPKQGSLGS